MTVQATADQKEKRLLTAKIVVALHDKVAGRPGERTRERPHQRDQATDT